MSTNTNPMLEAALGYIAQGRAVHPLKPLAKTPLTAHGFKDASLDPDQITRWWTDCPNANIGIATGAVSGISVLDVDKKEWEGKRGDMTLAALTAQHGTLPDTPMQMTWSGGMQIVFAYNPKAAQSANCYGPDLDGRNDGGYIVAPPSRVVEETREGIYCWFSDPKTTPLAPMPEWLLDRLTNANGNGNRAPRNAAITALRAGKVRNNSLTSLAGTLRRRGLEPEEILPMLAATGTDLPEDEITKIANSVGRYEPSEVADDVGGERFTDMMNAARLAQKGQNRAGHVDEMKDKWFVFRETRLVLEGETSMFPFVKEVARDFFEEAERIKANAAAMLATLDKPEELVGLDAKGLKKEAAKRKDARLDEANKQTDRALALIAAAHQLESLHGCCSAIEFAKAEPACSISITQLDAHPTWLNTPSGTLDLDTGALHAHRFTDYLTKVAGASYDPAAMCPRWDAFLAEVLPDPDVRSFMQRSVGYTLTDLTDEQCLWFLYGKGRNGKTTMINTLRAVLGDYAASTKASTLMVKAHGDDKRNDVAALRGSRFVSVMEAEDGQQMAESLIKELTGQDPVTVRMLYAEFFTFTPTFKIFLAANHKPLVRGTDLAIWRRIHLVPFTQTIALDQVDPKLKQRLAAEGPGILNWALAGYRAYRAGGLQAPKAVVEATREYQSEMDPLSDFLADACVVDERATGAASEIYMAYRRWSEANGVIPSRTMSQRTLGLRLQDRGFDPIRVGGRQVRSWRGLRPRL